MRISIMKERRVSDEENVAEQKVSEKFQIGDLVWAKMKSYPPWPGKIVQRPDNLKMNPISKVHISHGISANSSLL